MIRKFEKKDINAVMEIWKKENIRAHNFIAKEYWKDNYEYVKDINQHSGIGTSLLDKIKEKKDNLILNVYKKNKNAIKFYEKNNFIIISENIDKNTNEIEYTMNWKR